MDERMRKVRIPREQTREFEVDVGARVDEERADGEVGSLYPISISSELPVKRYSWDGAYYEVLSHEPEDVDLGRAADGLPALKNHQSRDQIGSVTGIRLDSIARRLRGMLGFSSIRLAKDQKTLVDEGHLKTISVGYRILGLTLIETDEEGVPTYRASWAPLEVSLVPVPADPSVGIGRAAGIEAIRSVAADDLAEFTVADHRADDDPAVSEREEGMDGEERKVKVETPAAPERDHRAEAVEISEVCEAHGRGDRVAQYLREGKTPDEVRRMILDDIRTEGPAAPASEHLLREMPAKDRERYSYTRAISKLSTGERLDGVEGEVAAELRANGAKASNGGILVPWRIRQTEADGMRTLGTGEAAGGAVLVDTQKLDMIDLLRSKTRVLEFGARFYPGLVGNVEFVKKTGAPTVYWMEENPASSVTQSEPSYGATTLSPKTLIGQIQYPRQLVVQSSIDVEADLTNELALGHAKAFDLAAIHGTGTAKSPVGIYSAANVQSHAVGGVPDIDDVGTMVGLVADADADYGALRWMTTPLMAAKLRRTVVVSGHPVFLWSGPIADGELDGYRAGATTQVSKVLGSGSDEHGLIFGNWNELVLGVWGNDLELVLDDKTRAGYGQIVITSYSMADVGIRHPEAFVKGTGAKIA